MAGRTNSSSASSTWQRPVGEGRSSDAALVEVAQSGEPIAFSTLYSRYHRYIAKILSEEVADTEARLDIAQMVFERAWLKLSTLRDAAAFRPWLAQITRRAVIEHHRRGQSLPVPTGDEWLADTAVDDWTAHDWAAMRELACAVDTAIDDLSARDAVVIELATTFEFDASEIAAALDVEPGHARVLLHRARQRLSRKLLSAHGPSW